MWDNWLMLAFLAPMFWALVNIIDVYFVHGIYENEYDGVIISSLFQMVPWVALFFLIDINFSSYIGFSHSGSFQFNPALAFLFLGGVLFVVATLFYFKTLFNVNDVVLLQIIWNFTAILVPILAFLIFREKLAGHNYLGIFLIFAGAIMLSVHSKIKLKLSKKYLKFMLGGVFFIALAMVLENRGYEILGAESLGSNGFWVGYFFFSLGFFFGGLAVMLWKKKNVFALIRKYYKVFLLAEALSFLGIMFSQRAMDMSPSVSFVAAIEKFDSIFIALFSLVILGYFYFSGRKKETYNQIYREQLTGFGTKTAAAVCMIAGVYFINQTN